MYRRILTIGYIFLILLVSISTGCFSADLYKKGGEIYDAWGICRTRAQGEDGYFQIMSSGFRPIIVFETLGEKDSISTRWGEQFSTTLEGEEHRARQIFQFVKERVDYTPDEEQFGYKEFAQNADELARIIEEGTARGDCEDYAILLASLYKMAGYRTAVALVPGHTAALVYMPDYGKTNVTMELGGKRGWVWAEATGKNNYLGWVPPRVLTGSVYAYEIQEGEKLSLTPRPGGEPVEVERKEAGIPFFLFFLFIFWIIPFLIRMARVLTR